MHGVFTPALVTTNKFKNHDIASPCETFEYPPVFPRSYPKQLPELITTILKKPLSFSRRLTIKHRQRLIRTHENTRLTVTQLYMKLRLQQTVASQHLAILRKAGIVSTGRYGKFIFYKINPLRMQGINKFVKNLA